MDRYVLHIRLSDVNLSKQPLSFSICFIFLQQSSTVEYNSYYENFKIPLPENYSMSLTMRRQFPSDKQFSCKHLIEADAEIGDLVVL